MEASPRRCFFVLIAPVFARSRSEIQNEKGKMIFVYNQLYNVLIKGGNIYNMPVRQSGTVRRTHASSLTTPDLRLTTHDSQLTLHLPPFAEANPDDYRLGAGAIYNRGRYGPSRSAINNYIHFIPEILIHYFRVGIVFDQFAGKGST